MSKIIRSQTNKNAETLASQDTSEIVAALLNKKDPTWTHLNRIIKKKKEDNKDYSLKEAEFNEFGSAGKKLFSEDEKEIINLESELKNKNEIIEELKNKIAQVEKSSYDNGLQQGLQKGLKDGYQKAKQEMDSQVEGLKVQTTQVINEVVNQKVNIFKQAERVVVDIILGFVKRVVNTEIKTNPDVIKGVTKKALEHIESIQNLTIKVNPLDIKKVKDEIQFWSPVNKNIEKASVEEDSRIAQGGCVISTEAGTVDASVETQLDIIENYINKIWLEENV